MLERFAFVCLVLYENEVDISCLLETPVIRPAEYKLTMTKEIYICMLSLAFLILFQNVGSGI